MNDEEFIEYDDQYGHKSTFSKEHATEILRELEQAIPVRVHEIESTVDYLRREVKRYKDLLETFPWEGLGRDVKEAQRVIVNEQGDDSASFLDWIVLAASIRARTKTPENTDGSS